MATQQQVNRTISPQIQHSNSSNQDIYRLRMQQNSMTPIGRLTDDIFVLIIEEILRLSYRNKPRYGQEWILNSWCLPTFQEWKQIGFVCARLRHLVLNTPSFWRVIELDYFNVLAQTTLIRNPNASYIFAHKFLENDYEDILNMMRTRVQYVSIVIDSKFRFLGDLATHIAAGGQKLISDMPKLNDLEVNCAVYSPVIHFSHLVDDGVAMRLTSLKVFNVPLPDGVALPQLRILEWHFQPRKGHHQRMWCLIASAPSLAYACLVDRNSTSDEYYTSKHTIGTAALSHLRTLVLKGRLDAVNTMLRVLPNPSRCFEVEIVFAEYVPSQEMERNAFFTRLRAFKLSGVRGMSGVLDYSSPPYYRLMGSAESDASLDVRCEFELSEMLLLLHQVEFDKLTLTTYAARILFSNEEWLRADLPRLEHIEFSNPILVLPNRTWREQLIIWLLRRAAAGLRVKTVTAAGLALSSRAIAELRDSGLVDTIVTNLDQRLCDEDNKTTSKGRHGIRKSRFERV